MPDVYCALCDAPLSDPGRWRGSRAPRCAACRRAGMRRRAVGLIVVASVVVASAALGAVAAVLALRPRIEALESERVASASAVSGGERDRGASEWAAEVEAHLRGLRAALDDRDALRDSDREAVERAVARLSEQLGHLAREMASLKSAASAAPDALRPPAPTVAWLELLKDGDAGVRLSALAALEGILDPRFGDAARELLFDLDPLVRAQAVRVVRAFGVEESLADLVLLLSDENIRVRAVACEAVESALGPIEGYDPASPLEEREAALAPFRERLR